MAIDSATPRTRRAIIMAGLGGVAASVAAALGRPAAVAAANGDPVILGQQNTATTNTQLYYTGVETPALSVEAGQHIAIVASSTDHAGLAAQSQNNNAIGATSASTTKATIQSGSNTGTAVYGYSGNADSVSPPAKTGIFGYANQDNTARGVYGNSDLGTGVVGQSNTGLGVKGVSTGGTGMRGESTNGTAIRAVGAKGRALHASTTSTSFPAIGAQTTGTKSAIQGFAGPGSIPAPSPETGVQGRADKSENSVGVLGESLLGTGVVGASDTGYGVFGVGYYGVYAFGQVGVVGDVDTGTGVQGWTGAAIAPGPPTSVGIWAGAENGRTALQVSGVAKFNRSGRTTFSAGQSSKKITVPGGITASSFAFADLQQDRPGVLVRAVVPNAADSSITIILNATVSSSTAVGWMVVS